jgi:hypothetical protein
MEDKKSEVLYRKAIKDFPDYSSLTGDTGKMTPKTTLKDIDIVSEDPILPFEKLTDVMAKSAIKPKSVQISPYNESVKRSEKPARTLLDTATDIRDIYIKKIGKEILKRNIDPYSELPVKTGFTSSMSSREEQEEPGLQGYYAPSTGNIYMRSGLSPEDYAGTYAHEAGHKIATQGLGIEAPKKISREQSILSTDYMTPKFFLDGLFEAKLTKTVDPAKLVDTYYGSHHRADAPSSWETQTLKNLESKGILNEPYTPEARPENIRATGLKDKYYDLLKKKNK